MKKVWVGNLRRMPETRRQWNNGVSEEFGFQLVEKVQDCDFAFIYNLPLRDWLTMAIRGGGKEKIQFLTEPKVVRPLAHKNLMVTIFHKRYLVGRKGRGGVFYPQIFPSTEEPLGLGVRRLNQAVIVNANKYSFIRGELYSLRRECAAGINELDTYGLDWDAPVRVLFPRILLELVKAIVAFEGIKLRQPKVLSRPLNNKGAVEDKLATMSRYKVALVTENSADYVSEKLFDAWFAGCIPVYVGPELRDWDIPDELYVRAEPTLDDIRRAIASALSMDAKSHQAEVRDWLALDETRKKWEYQAVISGIFHDFLGGSEPLR